jgi:hypothetical protein
MHMKPSNVVEVEPLRVGVLDAARIIGVSRARLYQHMKAGTIAFIKDGARTLFLVTELRAFVARSSRPALN